MTVRVRGVLPFLGESFEYEYDVGWTTILDLRVTGRALWESGAISRAPSRSECSAQGHEQCALNPRTWFALFVFRNRRARSRARKHRRQHQCGEDDAFLPAV